MITTVDYRAGADITGGCLVYVHGPQERSDFPDIDQMLLDTNPPVRVFPVRSFHEFHEFHEELLREIDHALRIPRHLLDALSS